MSGGIFDYKQYILNDISDELEKRLESIDENFENEVFETKIALKAATLTTLKKIQELNIYLKRLDWLFAGDDSPDTMLDKLSKDLNNLSN